MSEARAEIEVLGQRMTLRGPGSPEYLRELAEYLEGRIRAIQSETRVQDPMRLCVLAGLHVVDELFRLRQDTAAWAARVDALTAEVGRVLPTEGAPTGPGVASRP